MGILGKVLQTSKYVCPNKFNKFGARVYSTESIQSFLQLKKLRAPKQAVKAEILEVEKNFGKDKVRIISFKDKDNHLISRISQNGATKTHSTYKLDGDIYEVSRKTSENGKLQGTLHSTILKTSTNCNAVLRTEEIGNGARNEVQRIIYGEKELVTTGTRFADGSTKLETITGKNIENLDKFKNDPYIMIRNYTNSDFAESLHTMLSKRFGLKKKPKLKLHTESSKSCDGYYNDLSNSITVYSVNDNSKADLADTLAHELRHAKQGETGVFKLLKKLISGKKYSASELRMDGYFVKEDISYPYLINVPLFRKLKSVEKAYWKNGLESDARKWGGRIQKEYQRYASENSSDINISLLGNHDDIVAALARALNQPHKTVKLMLSAKI